MLRPICNTNQHSASHLCEKIGNWASYNNITRGHLPYSVLITIIEVTLFCPSEPRVFELGKESQFWIDSPLILPKCDPRH